MPRQPWSASSSLPLLGALAGGLLLSACSSSSSSGPSGHQLVTEALSHAKASAGVHEAVVATHAGTTGAIEDNTYGTSEGERNLNINTPPAVGMAHELLVNGIAYIKGDAKTLPYYFGLAKSNPAPYANQWLAIPPSSPTFTNASQGLTTSSHFGGFAITGPYTAEAATTFDGTSVTPIHLKLVNGPGQSFGATLYVSTTTPVLPVGLVGTYKGYTQRFHWTKWGVAPTLTTPSSSIPFSSVPQ